MLLRWIKKKTFRFSLKTSRALGKIDVQPSITSYQNLYHIIYYIYYIMLYLIILILLSALRNVCKEVWRCCCSEAFKIYFSHGKDFFYYYFVVQFLVMLYYWIRYFILVSRGCMDGGVNFPPPAPFIWHVLTTFFTNLVVFVCVFPPWSLGGGNHRAV